MTHPEDVSAEDLSRAGALARGLFPHQVEGIAFLLGRKRAILADDMGLGKTRQAILALQQAAPQGPYLVVCPASVKRNWAREITLVDPHASIRLIGGSGSNGTAEDPSATWTILNYDILSRHQHELESCNWAGMVFDEAHYLKNHTSQRSKLAARIAAGCPDAVVYALTGTPLTNRPRDLFPLLQLMNHALGRSFLSFAKRYCDAHENGYGWVTDGASNLQELSVQLHGVMLRRNKTEVLSLPPKLRSWLPVEVPQSTGASEIRIVVRVLLANQLGQSTGKRTTGRKPVANSSAANRGRLLASLTTARRKLAVAKVKATLDLVQGAVEQGEKVIVFSCFDEPVKAIQAHFDEAAVLLTGATPADKRQALVDRFQNEDGVRVFVANILAGGVGLNLTAARQVVFNDLDWVPANHWQAEDRAYRIGQTGTVNVTYLVGESTVDDFVRSLLESKAGLVEAVVEGGALEVSRDVLSKLERLIKALSPGLADLSREEVTDEVITQLLRDAAALHRQEQPAAENRIAGVQAEVATGVSHEALLALARALAGPKSVRYRAESRSSKGSFYELDVDSGGDVTCSCPGFQYRGMCSHSRDLKAILKLGGALPAQYTQVAN